MIGQNKIILTQEAIADIVQQHLNEHVFRGKFRAVKVSEENVQTYGNQNVKQWQVIVEPMPEPETKPQITIAETPKESP